MLWAGRHGRPAACDTGAGIGRRRRARRRGRNAAAADMTPGLDSDARLRRRGWNCGTGEPRQLAGDAGRDEGPGRAPQRVRGCALAGARAGNCGRGRRAGLRHGRCATAGGWSQLCSSARAAGRSSGGGRVQAASCCRRCRRPRRDRANLLHKWRAGSGGGARGACETPGLGRLQRHRICCAGRAMPDLRLLSTAADAAQAAGCDATGSIPCAAASPGRITPFGRRVRTTESRRAAARGPGRGPRGAVWPAVRAAAAATASVRFACAAPRAAWSPAHAAARRGLPATG